jgi:hypothetical protein
MQLRGTTFSHQHAFAVRFASVTKRDERLETQQQQQQGRINAVGLERMRVDEYPQTQTTHHQHRRDDFDDDDDNE